LLTEGNLAEAEQQFRQVLSQAHGRALSYASLAQARMARASLLRGDVPAAVRDAGGAVGLFDNVVGFRDVRMVFYLWCMKAQALLAAGDPKQARVWAQKALDASLQYDAPESAAMQRARELLRLAAGDTPR
jgi:hypothetical protein